MYLIVVGFVVVATATVALLVRRMRRRRHMQGVIKELMSNARTRKDDGTARTARAEQALADNDADTALLLVLGESLSMGLGRPSLGPELYDRLAKLAFTTPTEESTRQLPG